MREDKPGWAYKHPERWDQIEFNKNFLRKVEVECGELHCEYCGVENLVVYEWFEKTGKDVATVDHFYPSSRYPDLRQDENNFDVACQTCNGNKKDDIWEVETIVYPRTNKTKKILVEINN